MFSLKIVLLLILSLSMASSPLAQEPIEEEKPFKFAPANTCATCHPHIYEDYLGSMHRQAFSDPVFKAQFLQELLPRTESDPTVAEDAAQCIACHAPALYLSQRAELPGPEKFAEKKEGVLCDFCHTLEGMDENGAYRSRPEGKKLGPFFNESWHSEQSAFISTSEFCAVCHNASNRHGLEVKSTYGEWKESRYARDGIQCQDCHMNAVGYLDASGKAQYQKGKAAYMSGIQAGEPKPDREKLYTHRFPGAHSKSQINGTLRLRLGGPPTYRPGASYRLAVFVDNTKTGHKMPTGSTDLRQLWLEVALVSEDGRMIAQAAPKDPGQPYDVAGASEVDGELLGKDFPNGVRLYRSLFVDGQGKPTLSSYEATAVAFDNRLMASERRTENYRFSIPENLSGPLKLEARLVYLSYPPAFAEKLGISPASPVTIALSEKTVTPR